MSRNRDAGAARRHKPFWYLRRRSVASDVDEELNTHLAMRIDELVASGKSADEARREAMRQFGDLEGTRRYCREQDQSRENTMQRELSWQDLMQDFRIGARSLARVPLLTATIVATVGIGIGATVAIFSAIDAALLRPLPYASPDRLVRIYTDSPPFKFRFSAADYLAFTEQQTRFEQHATYTDRSVTFSNGQVAELLRARVVSWGFFSVLGISPIYGRDFAESDGRSGAPMVALVSHNFWQQRLGGRADAVGKSVRLDGNDVSVIGVLPPTTGPLERRQDLFLIQQFAPPPRKGPFLYSVIARLPAGADRGVAAGELRAINRALFPLWRASYQDEKATWGMDDLKTNLIGDVRAIAGVSLAAVALVWLIACANASNLLIARVAGRRQELAVRAALGASRGRVIRYLLVESTLLAAGAAMVAIAVTLAGMQLLQTQGATYFPRTGEIQINATLGWLMAGLAISSALLFGLMPAFNVTGGSVDESLRSSRSATASVGVRRMRRGLVAAQFAIATPLLIAAGLLLASLNALKQVDVGVDADRILSASVRLPAAQYREPARMISFWNELKRRLESEPGIAGVAFADGRPPIAAGQHNNFDLEQYPAGPGGSQPVTAWVGISPEYVSVMGMRLLEGRLLDQHDIDAQTAANSLLSVVVDQAWARRFFHNESAVGKRFKSGGCTTCEWATVVGVVSDVTYDGLDKSQQGTVYFAAAGQPFRYVAVRTKGDPALEAATLARVVRELEPDAPVSELATMDQLIDQSLLRPQSLSTLVAAFAGVALLLSVIGIYGVMGYYVQQQLKEISIRMALGGSRGDVARLVVGQGMTVVLIGVIVGIAIALSATRLMTTLLFQVGAFDVVTFTAVITLLSTTALLACALPAWRAMRLQPAAVLRNE
ncbi:MAG TPA: ABC transporter permease [Vicinamibacterales bacterium]|nr:ABC transporter permease [Vicinamibacterales bacterium]